MHLVGRVGVENLELLTGGLRALLDRHAVGTCSTRIVINIHALSSTRKTRAHQHKLCAAHHLGSINVCLRTAPTGLASLTMSVPSC